MAWTDEDLLAAFQALSPVPTSLGGAAATLNSQTTTRTVDVSVQSIAGYLGTNMKLEALIQWATSPPSGASPVSISAAQELAFACQNPGSVPVFEMSNPAVAAQMQTALTAIVSPGSNISGPITAADQSAILGLAQSTSPQWAPPVAVAHLQNLQRDGLISASIPVE